MWASGQSDQFKPLCKRCRISQGFCSRRCKLNCSESYYSSWFWQGFAEPIFLHIAPNIWNKFTSIHLMLFHIQLRFILTPAVECPCHLQIILQYSAWIFAVWGSTWAHFFPIAQKTMTAQCIKPNLGSNVCMMRLTLGALKGSIRKLLQQFGNDLMFSESLQK